MDEAQIILTAQQANRILSQPSTQILAGVELNTSAIPQNNVTLKITAKKRGRPAGTNGTNIPIKRRNVARTRKTQQLPDINELPHNLGQVQASEVGRDSNGTTTQSTRDLSSQQAEGGKDISPETTSSPQKRRRIPKAPYGLTPGVSPFPEWDRPTTEECEEVNRLLSDLHGTVNAPKAIPPPSLTVSGCGEVPSILDALIRTLLSGATTGNNSAMAFQGLVRKFGVLQHGIGKGSVDWNNVRQAPVEDIYEATKCGGLGAAKSKYIKQILEMVYEQNQKRWDALRKSQQEPNGSESVLPLNFDAAVPGQEIEKSTAIRDEEHILSLNHLHALPKDEAMLEFVKFPGIGVKTAACVVLFCLQRPCFAVDTHVFRLSKWLGWVPPEKVNEITAFSHLEVMIPDHLKYSLHQLFIRHGKSCPRCRAITGENSEGWSQGCVIDHLVKRTGKRKGGNMRQSTLSFKNVKNEGKDGVKDELKAEGTDEVKNEEMNEESPAQKMEDMNF
ncbi:hypothetical protein FQN57_002392 [Myotisia sp. PD_48]|nr:hypothetical protein FQN57_002392 [Myotisia sp. PD_48]